MAMPFLKSAETPLNLENLKKGNKTSNLKSFWAFMLSIFLYISAFYVFNLSPSTLLSTTKFWFFISNTLILIIAADFGTFSSSKEPDFYEEYVKNSVRANTVVPTFTTLYKKPMDQTRPEYQENDEKPPEKILDMVVPVDHHVQTHNLFSIKEERELDTIERVAADHDHDIQENKPEMVSIKQEYDHGEEDQDQVFERIKKRDVVVHPLVENGSLPKRKRKSKCARSNSDRAVLMLAAQEEEKKERNNVLLQRTLSERYEEEPSCNEENEFSRMSNEELNRRVEEFIQRFNRQIRLQAIRSRQSS